MKYPRIAEDKSQLEAFKNETDAAIESLEKEIGDVVAFDGEYAGTIIDYNPSLGGTVFPLQLLQFFWNLGMSMQVGRGYKLVKLSNKETYNLAIVYRGNTSVVGIRIICFEREYEVYSIQLESEPVGALRTSDSSVHKFSAVPKYGDPQINGNWDTTPTSGSTKPVTSGGIYTAINNKAGTKLYKHDITFSTTNVEAYSEGAISSKGTATVTNGEVHLIVIATNPEIMPGFATGPIAFKKIKVEEIVSIMGYLTFDEQHGSSAALILIDLSGSNYGDGASIRKTSVISSPGVHLSFTQAGQPFTNGVPYSVYLPSTVTDTVTAL